jgi:hypothetical protein
VRASKNSETRRIPPSSPLSLGHSTVSQHPAVVVLLFRYVSLLIVPSLSLFLLFSPGYSIQEGKKTFSQVRQTINIVFITSSIRFELQKETQVTMSDTQSGPNGLCVTTNSTIIDGFNITCEQYLFADTRCTLQTCPLSLAQITYVPTLEGNILYVALFGLMLIAQIFCGIRYRTWGFLGGMVGGLVLEILGYVSRILLNDNPFSGDWFKM